MILASDGLLYGTTYQNGGPFQVTTSGGNFRFLRIFSDSVEGSFFNTGVIEGVDGALYGRSIASTQTGIGGTLFKIQKNGTAYQALYTFPVDSDPRSNFNGVIQSSSGLLLAANPIGGVGGAGILLSINSAGGSATVVYDFGAAFTGSTPNALCLASDGRLYGATGTINGTLFGINQDGSGFASLHHFMGGTFDGANPVGISSGRNGYLYGITSIGGTAGAGTVFGLRTDGSQYSVIYNFNNAGPYYPIGIIQGNDGFLYITTESGGSAGLGAICKVAVDGTGFAVIHSFSYAGFDGQMPLAGVIQASDNALYGTTSSGGTAGKGVIFKVNTDGSGYTTLHNFGASTGDGTTPRTMLIEAADGGLYGWTGDGVLFRIQKDGSQYNVKFVLSQSSAASSPTNLLQGSDGWLYSTGSIRPPLAQVPAQGQMFRIGPNGTGFAIVEALTSPCDDGSIVIASNGSFYGVTTGSSSLGQTVPGVLFKIRFALMAPGISAQPQSQSAVVGQTVSFSVVAMGTAPLTYQWMKNNSVISGATSATYTLSSVQLTDAGLYSCTIGNAGGTLASVQATLTVSPAGPPITVQPVGQTVNCGGAATLSVVAVGSALTYQWQLNGTNIAGASSSTYTIATVGTLHAGAYTVVVGGSNGISTTSAPATLIVVSNAHPIAISTRGLVGSDSNILIAGFIISGTTSETLLLRGVGPTLGSSFQVPGVLAHPQLFLFDSKGHVLASNTGWGGDPAVAQAINRVYLFPFPAGSADCAILITLPPGTYTAQVSGANSTTGVALIEVYDVPAN